MFVICNLSCKVTRGICVTECSAYKKYFFDKKLGVLMIRFL